MCLNPFYTKDNDKYNENVQIWGESLFYNFINVWEQFRLPSLNWIHEDKNYIRYIIVYNIYFINCKFLIILK